MPEPTQVDNPWKTRVIGANKQYVEWQGKFKCKQLEEYYEGFQWKQRRDYPTTNYNPYTINLVYSTIKIKLSALLFQNPKYLITPTPGNSQWNEEFAIESSNLKQDVLNTIVSNPNVNFTKHIKLAALDSFFRFGIIEAGYANDWRNPQKIDPQLESWEDSQIDIDKDKVEHENPVPVNERFYIKRIRPSRFRTCVTDATDLRDCDWCGYYDYYYTRVLRNTASIDWPTDLTSGSYISAEYATGLVGATDAKEDYFNFLVNTGEISRVWHIWDQVIGKRLLLLDDENMHELWSGEFSHLPLIDLRWDFRTAGFYPIPPVFQWLSPQDEINEAREQTRSYRRRFTRKFQTMKGMIDEEEKEKFSSGPDGILVEVKQMDAIKAIDNPEMGPTSENALNLAKDDFNIISGTSAEARGQDTDRETATQAKIIDTRSQIRESAEQMDFAQWLGLVGRELLNLCQERLVEGLWVKYTSNPGGPADPQQFQSAMPVYKYVTSQQLDDGYDYEVRFDIQNATPAAMAQEQAAFVNFMSMVQNFPIIMTNGALIREAAYRCGYRNEQVIKQVQQSALVQAQLQAQNANQQAQPSSGKGANTAKARSAQMATPSGQEIQTQLNNQIQ